MAVSGILIVLSLQPTFIEVTEQGLANHMVFEHTLFFIAGALSVMIAETVRRFLRNAPFRNSSDRIIFILYSCQLHLKNLKDTELTQMASKVNCLLKRRVLIC